MSVTMATLMYAAPVWGSLVRFKTHLKGYESTQRLASIRQINAYRTVWYCAAYVLAGNISINIAIKRSAEIRQAFSEGCMQTKYMKFMGKVWRNGKSFGITQQKCVGRMN